MVHVGFNFSRRKPSVSLSPYAQASFSFTTKILSFNLKRKSKMLFWGKISSQEVGGHGCLSECCELGKQRGETTAPKGIPRWHTDSLWLVSVPYFCFRSIFLPFRPCKSLHRHCLVQLLPNMCQVGQGLEQIVAFPGISWLVLPLCSATMALSSQGCAQPTPDQVSL